MLDAHMAATKTPRKPAPKTEGRKKSKLTQAGDRAKWETERALLVKTLKAKDWNLTHTAAELEMGSPTAVLHAIDRYDLRGQYEAAKSS